MLKNYFQITFRNLKRQKGYSFINLFGLATGMAAFVLIVLFVQNELSFDSGHEHRDDTYRVVLDARVADQEILTASSPAIMATQFLQTFPEIASAVRINNFSSDALFKVEGLPFYQDHVFEADSSVFDVFTFPLVAGNATTALNRPNTAVISERVARKFFGSQDPMGQTIQYDNRRDYEIVGVMADVPHNSHFRPEILLTFLSNSRWDDEVWLNNSFSTYLRLEPSINPTDLEAKFPDFLRTFVGPQIEQFMGQSYDQALESGLRYGWLLEPMSDIYLYSETQDQIGQVGDIRYLYILGVIALFVLTIACINFMNLSTARATGRAREVGIRKTMGSERGQLIRQFLSESTTMAVLAMLIAFVLVWLTLPTFSTMSGSELSLAPWIFGAMVAIAVVTGIAAGLYPALVLSGFQPALVLKGSFSSSKKGRFIRSGLVVFQFGVSIVLLVGTGIVYKQIDFMQSQDLGFNQEHVVVVPVETQAGIDTFETFRSQVMRHSNIINAASAGMIPGPDHIHNHSGFRGEGMSPEQFFIAGQGEVSDDYVETLGLKVIAGRDFDPAYPSDSTAFVITNAVAGQMGFTAEEVIGKTLARLGGAADGSDRVATVIGVVEDAHFTSLHSISSPLVFAHWNVNMRYVPIRINSENVDESLALIEEAWTAWEPGYPFRYFFMDADYAQFYEQEQRLGRLYTYFTILAILIACLGLFGLASFVTTQRTKEIGVRKVMGASVPRIVVLLSREFTILVLLGCLVGFPVAWYAMGKWLQDFAYATSMGWPVFVLSGVSALLIAWLTVGYQSVKAATANPIKSLRYE